MSKAKVFDWAGILERIKQAEDSAGSAGIDKEYRQAVLARRAQALASLVHDQEISGAQDPVMILRSGDERFALPLADLVEVVVDVKVAAVPYTPTWVAGLIQVRGEIRPVYHLRRLLGYSEVAVERPTTVLLVRYATGAFGIGVDSIEDVRTAPQSARKPIAVARGQAGWATEDLIPCLSVDSLLRVDSLLQEEA